MCRPSDFPPHDDPTIFPPIVDGLPTWDSEVPRPYIDMLDKVDPKQAPSWDSTPYAGNAMNEPMTEAGKRLAGHDDHPGGYFTEIALAIEAEAVNAALGKVAADIKGILHGRRPVGSRRLPEAARPKP